MGLLYCKKLTPRLRATELWNSLSLVTLTKDDAEFRKAYYLILDLSCCLPVSLRAAERGSDPLGDLGEALSEELKAKVFDEFVSNLFTRRKE